MFKFPYTNLHELNLDWILDKVKTLVANNDEFNEKADYAVETADEAKTIAEQAAQATIADGSVTTIKLADGAVTGNKIAQATIQTGNLSAGCVTTPKILDDAITTPKIADNAVTNDKIAGTIPISKGGTGGTTADTAKNNLGLEHMNSKYYSVATGASVDVTFDGTSRGCILISGGLSACKDIVLFGCQSSGSTNATRVLNASGINITFDSFKIVIENTSGVGCFILVLDW